MNDLNEYINKLEQCQNEHIVLDKCKYDHPIPKYIKGYMLDDVFYPSKESD